MTLPKARRDIEEKLLAQGLKECRRCHVIKTLDNFGKKKKNPGGMDHWCRDCNKVMHERYRGTPEGQAKDKAQSKKWKAEHRQDVHNYNLEWNSKHKDLMKSLRRQWHLEHLEYENSNARARMKIWVAQNRERHNKHGRDRRMRELGAEGAHETEQWLKIVEFTDGICPACGKPMSKPTLDHVIPVAWGGSHYIWNVQAICKKCNSMKGDRFAADYRPLPARAWAYQETYGTLDEGFDEQAALEWWVKLQALGMGVEAR